MTRRYARGPRGQRVVCKTPLPPYSPDLNPIEMAISKMKSLLRKLGRRSIEDLEAAIAEAMQSITKQDARGFIKHCGHSDTSE